MYYKILRNLLGRAESQGSPELPSEKIRNLAEGFERPASLPAASLPPFRPFAEPILKPRNEETRGGLHYPDVYQNAFQPKEKNEKVHLPPSSWHSKDVPDEQARVFAPNGESVDSLLDAFCQSPPNELDQLLPEGASKQEYLPAIQLAIKCISWKRRATQHLQALSNKIKNYWRKPTSKAPISDWEGYVQSSYPPIPSDEQSDSSPLQVVEWSREGWEAERQAQKVKDDALISAYCSLEAVLRDYQHWGLLHYRPYYAMQIYQDDPASRVVRGIISSWAEIYDLFSRDRWGSGHLSNHTGQICRQYFHLHREIQKLAASVVYRLPQLPSVNDTDYKNADDYYAALTTALNRTADYLQDLLVQFLDATPHSKTSNETVEAFRRQWCQAVKFCNLSLYRAEGVQHAEYTLAPEEAEGMPPHLITEVSHCVGPVTPPSGNVTTPTPVAHALNTWVGDVIRTYCQYIEKSGKTLRELTGFPGQIAF